MKFVSDDGKTFDSVEACKAYEAKKGTEKDKLLSGIEAITNEIDELQDKMHDLVVKRGDLIRQYWDKYPEAATQDIRSIFEDEDEDCDGCCDCENYDECIVEAASELVWNFEKLQELIHALD